VIGRLARILDEHVEQPVELRLNTNRRTMMSFREVWRSGRQMLRVSIHRKFCDAPEPVLLAVAAWLNRKETAETKATLRHWMHGSSAKVPVERTSTDQPRRASDDLFPETLPASSQADTAQTSGREQSRRARNVMPPAPPNLMPQGRFHDLRDIADRMNYQYFEGKCPVHVTWGSAPEHRLPPGAVGGSTDHFTGGKQGRTKGKRQRASRRSKSIIFGTYVEDDHLVRVHPRLDAADVPAYFVEFVVYHEMLHKYEPPEILPSGRRNVHTRRFRHLERRFPHFQQARQFEKEFMQSYI
jgi:hypothetical protein